MASAAKDPKSNDTERRPTKPADLGSWTITFDPKLIELIGKAHRTRSRPNGGSEPGSEGSDAEPGKAERSQSDAEDR